MPRTPQRPRNDPRQYDDLADEWWRPDGAFAALHWLAAARAAAVPRPREPGALLVDVGCGAGLLAPHLSGRGFRHVGVDLTASALTRARDAGVEVVQGDAARLPLGDAAAEVVVAGEILEHVGDLASTVAECCRILAPGGTLVVDTIAGNPLARLVVGRVQERLPGGPPPRIHDPALFVSPRRLRVLCNAHGVRLRTHALTVHPLDYLRFLVDRRRPVRMRPGGAPLTVYQAIGWRPAESHSYG
nr:methyltransferase domain-containing protein [Egibacter rhizosphaerae]